MTFDQTTARGQPRPAREDATFTLEQANRALVLVRKVVADLVAHYRELLDLKDQRDALVSIPASDEQRNEISARVSECVATLNRLHQELTDVGCVLKDWESGLVDFPARYEGRRVWLCWQLDEPQIDHWHELHEGFAGRKPVDHDFDGAFVAE